MALNLSTLTSPATSGDVLAEALTTADFLEGCPVLRNLSRGSNKGGDAKQDVALNQPKALPLLKNPAGNLGGYLYIPNASGNYATGPSVTIGANQTWQAEVDMVITQYGNYILPMGGGLWASGFGVLLNNDQKLRVFSKNDSGTAAVSQNLITLGTPFNIKYGFDGTNIYADIDDTRAFEAAATSNQANSIAYSISLNHNAQIGNVGNYAIQKAKLTVNNAVVFDCDFNGSTSIRHGDTKFNCVGGPVTLTRAGNDPVTVVKKDILRFDGANDFMDGVFGQTITGGYMFAAFSVLGDGGEEAARVFGINSVGGADTATSGAVFSIKGGSSNQLRSFFGGTYQTQHELLFDDSLGDILHEQKILNGSQIGRVNNADAEVASVSTVISAEEFSLGSSHSGSANPAIDLEYLALFPASITDDQADSVRSYINNRNNVFDLVDSEGFYWFNPLSLSAGAVSTWNGRIVGSDNGDADLNITQTTGDDQPQTDGYTVTFADNTDHLEIPSTTQAGWQVVGTSLGTFAYRVNANAVTELNLLGNFGSSSYRQVGDLYGIILLPESATGADIEAARKLLIDRGAADASTITSAGAAWFRRYDIVEFRNAEFPDALTLGFAFEEATNLSKISTVNAPLCTNFASAWKSCSALQSFPAGAKLGTEAASVNFNNAWESSGLTSFSTPLPTANSCSSSWWGCTSLASFSTQLPEATTARFAWYNNTSLSDFRTTDIKNCSDFTSAWNSCSALTSFPAGAKLGTEANNVNFTNAWRSSGLTSFSTPLPTATNVAFAWLNCSSLTSFSSELPLANSTAQAWYGCSSLTSFSVDLPSASSLAHAWYDNTSLSDFSTTDIKNCTNFTSAWQNCSALTSFPAGAKLGTEANNVNFTRAWQSSGLTSFSTPLPTANNLFKSWATCLSLESFSAELPSATLLNYTWNGCTALDSFSSELSSVVLANNAWQNCTSLTDFSADVFANWNPSSITSGVFNDTWDGCSALSAVSVENILTSIDASNQHGTDDGTSTGSPLGDSGIDIDYNVATGSLSAATNSAVTSLKAKGWSIIVNNVTL